MKKGFTLAEVLITLAIIGIVAALTIPSVISNYQQQEFKTGLKKAVSVLNEAIQTNISQEGETPYDNYELSSYLTRHMNVLKKTSYSSSCYDKTTNKVIVPEDITNCYSTPNSQTLSNNIFYTTDGMRFEVPLLSGHNGEYPKYILHESGVNIAKHPGYGGGYGHCGSYGLNIVQNKTSNYPCVLMVDVNGEKKPNPPAAFNTYVREETIDCPYCSNGIRVNRYTANQTFSYSYPSPSDKKLQDIFTIMITDEKAIPFGVVAQRAMYSK